MIGWWKSIDPQDRDLWLSMFIGLLVVLSCWMALRIPGSDEGQRLHRRDIPKPQGIARTARAGDGHPLASATADSGAAGKLTLTETRMSVRTHREYRSEQTDCECGG